MKTSLTAPRLGDLPDPVKRTGWPWTEASAPPPPVGVDGGAVDEAPRVTIVTPSYNQGQFLEETLRSVLLQGYPNLEFIVLDGGSTDDSRAILERYDPFLSHWESHPDAGQSDALNRGFKRAGGEIIGWVNSDDLLSPGAIAASVAALVARPEAGFSYGDWAVIDAASRVISHETPPEVTSAGLLHSLQSYVAQTTLFFRRSALQQVDWLDVDLHLIMDFDLLLRLTARFESVRASGEIARFRIHPDAKTPTLQTRAWRERDRVVRRFLEGPDAPAAAKAGRRKILAAYHRQAALYGLRTGRPQWLLNHAARSLANDPGQVFDPRLWVAVLRGRK
jgi:glycosyltransferase involved in cell wall biosynthesis